MKRLPAEDESLANLLPHIEWRQTAIGDRASWSASLHATVSICFKSRFPMIIFWGPDLVQIYNDAYIPILGDKHPDALGQRAADCWPEIWESIGPMLHGVLRTNEATWAENLLLPLYRNGRIEECYFTFSYSPVEDDGRVGGVFCAVTETTAAVVREREAQQRAEQLAALDRAKTDFFSNVSHEFRTPLTLMLGPLTELQKSADPEQRPLVEAAQRSSLRLLKLVNTLLDFSRLEAGHVDAAFSETDLVKVTTEIVGIFASPIENAGLRLTAVYEAIPSVHVDRSMWERILLNLLSNALKFTLAGEIRVSLVQYGLYARLVVSDTGVGIPTAELPHIFERFRRVRGLQSRSHEGSGIGLALVAELVHVHGGHIDVTSVVGHGTTFTIDIPFGLNHLDPALIVSENGARYASAAVQYLADIDATPDSGASAITGIVRRANESTVLVVDDNADLRSYITRLLMPFCDVTVARNGLEALSALRDRPVQLVISDVMMPDMDGFELVRNVRADPQLESTRFIFLSARAGESSASAGLDHGADDYLVKPFAADDLIARVRAQLRAERRAMVRKADASDNWFERAGDPATNDVAFHAFADQLPIMLFQQDVDGALSFTNRVWHETLQLPRDRASYTIDAWNEIVHPEDVEGMVRSVSAAIPGRRPWQVEYRLRPLGADDDAYRWHIARGEPFFTATGEFRGWNGSIIDVHEARLREEADRLLHLESAKGARELRALADTIPAMVWTADATGWIDWYNQRWFDYTGQTPEQAEGWGWQAAHHPDDFPRVMQAWPQSILTGEPFEMEFRLRRRDGVFHSFLTRAVPLRNENGSVYRWYGSNVDINEQKEALDRSRHIAERLQGVFFPGALPQTDRLQIDAVYQAAERDALVGGDWFDATRLPDGRILLSIGDVTGHGLDASIVAARLRHAIVDFALTEQSPAAVLANTNTVLRMAFPDVFATALVAFVDGASTQLTYASAGHHGPLVAEDGHVPARSLPVKGLLLGVSEQLDAKTQEFPLPADSVVAFYTDGILEFSRNIIMAEEKLASAVSALVDDWGTRPAARVRDAVLGNAASSDDIAILVARISPTAIKAEVQDPVSKVFKTWRFHSSDAHTAQTTRHGLMDFIRMNAIQGADLFAAETVLGELLANMVEHAPGLVEIALDWTRADEICLTARDNGPGLPPRTSSPPSSDLSEDGRGLLLIEMLATSVRISERPDKGTEFVITLAVKRVLQL